MRLQFESISPTALPGKGEAPAEYAIVGIAPSTRRPKERALEPFGAKSWAIVEGLRRIYPSIYVTNAVKEPHAPGKKPTPTTIREATPLLLAELGVVQPRRILALGDVPARMLAGPSFAGLREDRGTFFWNPTLHTWVVPTYHFSAGARNPAINRFIDRDLERFFTLPDPEPAAYDLWDGDPRGLLDRIPLYAEVILDIETTGLERDAKVTQVGLKWGREDPLLMMDPTPEQLRLLGEVLKRRKCSVIGHNLSFDLRCLLFNTDSHWPRTPVHDTMVLAHLSGEEILSLKHLGTMVTDRPGPHFGGGPGDPLYLAEDVLATEGVFNHEPFQKIRCESYAYSVLRDLVPMVAGIYHRGVYIDREMLLEIKEEGKKQVDRTHAALEELSGNPGINWGSTPQVVELFRKLKIPMTATTKAGNPSVKEAALLPLVDEYPVVKALLEYRAAAKLLSGFVDPYIEWTKDEPYLRPRLKLTGTATGRLSCSDPNLQQVSREGPLKNLFVPRWEGGYIGLVDLDQAELRIAAMLSGDEALAHALLSEDTHRFIASKVFKKPMDQITSAERKASKKITFGVLYGGTAEGLAFKSDLPVNVVMEILTMLTKEFPALAKWMRRKRREAVETGEIRTLFGRCRRVDHLLRRGDHSRVGRLAVNTPIQSLASDSMLVVTRGVDRRTREKGLKSRVLFGVHDSLLLEVYPDEEEKVAAVVQRSFQDLWDSPLKQLDQFTILPLTGTFMIGPSWASVESTNAGYAPVASWACSSTRGEGPSRSLILSREDRDDWDVDDVDDGDEWEDVEDVD